MLVSWNSITSRRGCEFFIFLLALETGMMGVFASLDLILFFVFWEVMLIPMYFLIGIWGHERRVYAAIKFVLFTMVGSALMLVGIIYLYTITHTFDFQGIMNHLVAYCSPPEGGGALALPLAFFLRFCHQGPNISFSTRGCPTLTLRLPQQGSVILAGVLLKMGTYGMLRFCLPLFPIASQEFAPIICVLAIIGIIYGALVAMVQPDLKKRWSHDSPWPIWDSLRWGFSRSGRRRLKGPSTKCSATAYPPAPFSCWWACSMSGGILATSVSLAAWPLPSLSIARSSRLWPLPPGTSYDERICSNT